MTRRKYAESDFTGTRFDSAADKASFVNAMLAFADAGFTEKKFTKRVYDGLYLHCFGHIAHYNKSGFYDEWFSSDERQMEWMEMAAGGGPYAGGYCNPAVTWCDVEAILTEKMRARLGKLPGM